MAVGGAFDDCLGGFGVAFYLFYFKDRYLVVVLYHKINLRLAVVGVIELQTGLIENVSRDTFIDVAAVRVKTAVQNQGGGLHTHLCDV